MAQKSPSCLCHRCPAESAFFQHPVLILLRRVFPQALFAGNMLEIHGHITIQINIWHRSPLQLIGNAGTRCVFELFHGTVAPCTHPRPWQPSRGTQNSEPLEPSGPHLTNTWSANGEALGHPGHPGHPGHSWIFDMLPWSITSLWSMIDPVILILLGLALFDSVATPASCHQKNTSKTAHLSTSDWSHPHEHTHTEYHRVFTNV